MLKDRCIFSLFRISLVIVCLIYRVISFHFHSLPQHKGRYEGIYCMQGTMKPSRRVVHSLQLETASFNIARARQICPIFDSRLTSGEHYALRMLVLWSMVILLNVVHYVWLILLRAYGSLGIRLPLYSFCPVDLMASIQNWTSKGSAFDIHCCTNFDDKINKMYITLYIIIIVLLVHTKMGKEPAVASLCYIYIYELFLQWTMGNILLIELL
jgi:hypothetical protein